jgi:hypothetical protein
VSDPFYLSFFIVSNTTGWLTWRTKAMNNHNDTIGNRTHYLPACSAVPEQTASSRAHRYLNITIKTDLWWENTLAIKDGLKQDQDRAQYLAVVLAKSKFGVSNARELLSLCLIRRLASFSQSLIAQMMFLLIPNQPSPYPHKVHLLTTFQLDYNSNIRLSSDCLDAFSRITRSISA